MERFPNWNMKPCCIMFEQRWRKLIESPPYLGWEYPVPQRKTRNVENILFRRELTLLSTFTAFTTTNCTGKIQKPFARKGFLMKMENSKMTLDSNHLDLENEPVLESQLRQ
ncbi:hypothetical protein Ocin01_20195 [Orchesella cincta]|uniref:Uncharacterized protein n=1 Tax=Orchesella cincta TaxID=48709 RepID=A0A1D2M0K3_ORCCI|nr:hypothetical protein Ocin01_20195 [Orchesella cincta]